jgi:hypothetical protein
MFSAFLLLFAILALNLLRHLWVGYLFRRACQMPFPFAEISLWAVKIAPDSDLYTKHKTGEIGVLWFDRIAHRQGVINAAWL